MRAPPCSHHPLIAAGNALSQWNRRFFVLSPDGILSYYKKAHDAAAGRTASGGLECMGALVAVESSVGTTSFSYHFTLETKERVLSLRAETDVDRSSWVCASW